MREIKFRSWAHGSMWLVNGLACSDESDSMDLIDDSIGGYREVKHYDVVESRVLMQYTGLKDKNGKEIYEGDIIKSEIYETIGEKYVIDDIMRFHYDVVDLLLHEGDLEVIGNVYEHSDLLK